MENLEFGEKISIFKDIANDTTVAKEIRTI